MTRIRPIPETKDPATLRLELELLLQQPVPGPEQLERALPLLHSVDNIPADQWRNLQALPLWVDTETLDLAVPSDWEEPEWRSLINALPESGRTVRLHPVLQQDLIRQKVLPDMALNMLAIGEETGEMDRMLSKVADFYEDEVGAMVKALTSMQEPAMIVVVGGIVGSILLAMYLPMFTVFDQIQ